MFGRTEQLEKQSLRTYVGEGWKYRTYWKIDKETWSWRTRKWCASKTWKQNKKLKKEKQKKIRLRKGAFKEDMMKKNNLKPWRMNFDKQLNERLK